MVDRTDGINTDGHIRRGKQQSPPVHPSAIPPPNRRRRFYADDAVDGRHCQHTENGPAPVSSRSGRRPNRSVGHRVHQDMDFFTFLDSSTALAPWFGRMFCIGWDHSDLLAEQLFQALRSAGRQAEQAMLRATGGSNTHKGLIFSLGLLCGAMGAVQATQDGIPPLTTVLGLCSEMGKCACRDFEHHSPDTNGLICYRDRQITGVRGEAANGFPSAVQIGLPSLQRLCAAGRNLNDAAVITLLHLLANVTDTNMMKRGGFSSAESRRKQAKALLTYADKADFLHTLRELDRQYIQENLSPGGCADLLSISLMLYFCRCSGLLS